MPDRKIVIAAQSPISRALIGRMLADLPGFALCGEATSAAEAMALIDTTRPDLAVIGAGLAAGSDFPALRARLIAIDCRWIEIAGRQPGSAACTHRDARALPVLHHDLSKAEAAQALRTVLAAPIAPAGQTVGADAPETPDRFILIGASTGGVDALIEILSAFPADCPPTAIVQHTGRGHTGSLVPLLDQKCRADVVAPRDGMELRRGMVCIAAGGERHLHIAAGTTLRCLLKAGPPVSGHMPSVDELFRSAAPWAHRAVGVILTGMGNDGATGLAALRRAGATTLGQDAATSLVYGMPRAAWETGAVEKQLPLSAIAGAALKAAERGLETGSPR